MRTDVGFHKITRRSELASEVQDTHTEYENAILNLNASAVALERARGEVEVAAAMQEANTALTAAEATWLKLARLYEAWLQSGNR
jgi:hypothetical protein